MERPSPNQLPPEYTGPEAPVANPEMLEQQDLRYGMMELTGNIQKIIESGNEEGVGDYLREVVNGKNESVSPNERRAAFELLATEEISISNERTISNGKDVVDGLVERDDITNRYLLEDEKDYRTEVDGARDLFTSEIKGNVHSQRYDRFAVEGKQQEFRTRIEKGANAISRTEENMGSWHDAQQNLSNVYIESYERRAAKVAGIERGKKSLMPGYEGKQIELDKLVGDKAVESAANKIKGLASQDSEDAIEEILGDIEKGSPETETLIAILYSFASHRLSESVLTVKEINRNMKDIKRVKTNLVNASHGFDGQVNNRFEEESYIQQEEHYLRNFQTEADEMIAYEKHKLHISGLNIAEASQAISRYLKFQQALSRPA